MWQNTAEKLEMLGSQRCYSAPYPSPGVHDEMARLTGEEHELEM